MSSLKGGLNSEQQAFIKGYETATNTLKNIYKYATNMNDAEKQGLLRAIAELERASKNMPKNFEMPDLIKESYEDGALVRGAGDDGIVQ